MLVILSQQRKSASYTVFVFSPCPHQLNTPLVAMRFHELQYLALKFGHISSLLEYMSASLKCMHEAWEDLLLMMDTKLASYASVS